ncbi:MAG: FAD-dependent oxidoreductase [Clostridium sp.]|nr:FAD-dependent oxidoreductase [Clostridium sp.]
MESIWRMETDIEKRAALKGNIKTEVAVIGAGMAGILTAYFLMKQGKHVVVLEKNRIGNGQTGNTTAKITSQHGYIYSTLVKYYGEKNARLYARANEAAIADYRRLIDQENIDCCFEMADSYLYSQKDDALLKKEFHIAKKLGLPVSYVEDTELPFAVKGALCFKNQAQLQPLAFVKHIARHLTIYENTEVLHVSGHKIRTNNGTVYADSIVFAAHYPFPKVPGFYFLRQHQERSYVIAIRGIPKFKGMYYPVEQGLSLRWYQDMLLVGGGAHRTGESTLGKGYTGLKKQIDTIYKDYTEVARWSAQDALSHNELPFIGHFSVLRPYWYVATGFKKWGMTGSMIAAQINTALICGKENEFARLFTPQRLHPIASCKKLFSDLGVSMKGLSKGQFYIPIREKSKPLKGQAKIVRCGIRRYGLYTDDDGTLHAISVKCPHMGCELAWNSETRTWDCPCHGSRFTCDGALLDGPSLKDCMKR